jgi:hypothetical protein
MSIKHKHDKVINKKIKKIITLAAKSSGMSRNEFHNSFVYENNVRITEFFWELIWSEFPETRVFDKVSYCRGCEVFYFDDLMYGNPKPSH